MANRYRRAPRPTARGVTIIAVAALTAATFAGCRSLSQRLYRPPTVALRDVAVAGVGLTGASLRVKLLVRNPNFYSLRTAGMRYQLLAGDSTPIATGVDTTHRRVSANDSAIVELPVLVNWQALSAAGRVVAANGLVPYQLVGDITLDTPVGAHDVHVSQTGSFAPLR